MEALILKPANAAEAWLLKRMAKRMKVRYAVLNDKYTEGFPMAQAILAAKNSKVVSEENILKKLKS